MKSLLKYNRWCEEKPYKSAIITTGIITVTGDLLTQYLLHRMKEPKDKNENKVGDKEDKSEFRVDVKRACIMGSYGLLVAGPMFGVWYNKILPRLAPMDFSLPKPQLLKQLAVKVIWDETLMSCSLWTCFLFYATFMETMDIQKCKEKWKKDFLTLYKGDLCFWPPIVCSVFYFSPLHLQPVFISTANVIWSAYCSYVQYDNE